MKGIELILGDCLEKMKGIPDNSIDMVLCDPPYGTTACKWDTVIPLDLMWEQLKRITKDNGAICLFGQNLFTARLILSNHKMFKYSWVWEKEMGTGFLNAKLYPMKNNEDIIVFCNGVHFYSPQFRRGKPYKCKKGGRTENYNKDSKCNVETISDGSRYPLTVIKFNRDKNKLHPTQKPIQLLQYLIKTYTLENETILDFTMGSGSTGMACLLEKRKFIGIEKDEKYFEIAKKRIDNFDYCKD